MKRVRIKDPAINKVFIGSFDIGFGGEESNADGANKSRREMNGGCFEWVIHFQNEQQIGGGVVDDAAEGSDDDRGEGLNDSTSSCDANQTREQSVQSRCDLDAMATHDVDEQDGQGTRGSTQCRIDGRQRCRDHASVDTCLGGRVERVPAEPEEKCSQHDQRLIVAANIDDVALSVKATGTRSQEPRGEKCGAATRDMDDTGAREIEET